VRLPYKKVLLLVQLSFLSFFYHADAEERLVIHGKASPLNDNAQVSSWPRFNGPNDNATTFETHLSIEKGSLNIKKIWELQKGEGYASPAITKNRIVLFHLQNGHEIIEARNPETGKRIWSYQYPAQYRDRYGYSNGPRASPVIWNGKVYAHGVTAWLTCLDLDSGELIWKRDLKSEFDIPDYFFGKGSNPLVIENSLILNVGGSEGQCVVSFDLLSGKTKWITKDTWGASYSSPVKAKINNKKVCLVFTGGESRPPHGGLLIIDAQNGKKLSRFPWRSSSYESANAVSPVTLSGNQIFLSECYEKGGVLLHIDSNFNAKVVWHKPELNIHWMTPIEHKGYLYGIAGRHQRGAEAFCTKIDTGREVWRNRISWTAQVMNRELNLELFRGSYLKVQNHYLGLSELGSLVLLKMNEQGFEILDTQQLFFAPETWTLPALSHGLLFIMQNETDRSSGEKPRIICYDLRAN
jgi:outer membrane protein assembly factor BamB